MAIPRGRHSLSGNRWESVHPSGWLPPFRKGLFAIYRASFTPRKQMQREGYRLILPDVTGKAQVYVDGKMVSEKKESDKQSLTIPMPPGEGERDISILIEATSVGASAGLGATVTLE